jgi:molecular chaperone DnaK
MPSVVNYGLEENLLVGEVARRQSLIQPENTIHSVKRLMGKTLKEVKNWHGPELEEGGEGAVRIKVPGRSVSPQEVSSEILRALKRQAEEHLGQEVTDAVITVPAYFNNSERAATREAGEIAGLNVLRIINEPTAAALAYGLGNERANGKSVLVFDLGGGTFDVSLLSVDDGVFDVIATSGDNSLGGDDWDHMLAEYVISHLRSEYPGYEPADAWPRILEACERAKHDLSGLPSTRIDIPYLGQWEGNPVHLSLPLTRPEWEALCADLFKRLLLPLEQVLKDSGYTPDMLDEVLLVGGMTRVPMISTIIESVLRKKPSRSVNPDEAVAIGAAIQANVLATGNTEVLLLDVTPLSLGIETRGGVFTPLIHRNTTIPTRVDDVFTTAEDNQPNVEIHILQGERSLAKDNRTLARLYLHDIPAAPRGIPQIGVTFALDTDGILQITARDLGTGTSKSIRVETAAGLEAGELEKLIRESQERARDDRQLREQVELTNRIESMAYSAENALKTWGERLSPSARAELADTIYATRRALTGGVQYEELQELAKKLENTSHNIAGELYGQEETLPLGGEVLEAEVLDGEE